MNRTGKSPGLTLRKHGGVVISTGSRRCATVSAVCTSSAAPSMLRLRSNWMVICVWPERRVRGHRGDAGDGRELPLDRGCDRGRHGLRARARQRGRDLDGREVDPRQRRDRQQPVAEDAEDDERRRDQRRHHRAADADFGNVHVRISALSPRIGHPASRWTAASWPSVTTTSRRPRARIRSPTTPSTVRSTLTGRTLAAPSLTTNTKCAGLADLHRRRRHRDRAPRRAASARC